MLALKHLLASLVVSLPIVAQSPSRISANQMRGDLSFLASDELAGRFTPSPGLNVAAEFIASRFRAAGLQPLPDGTYFQTAQMIDRTMPQAVDGAIRFNVGGNDHAIAPSEYSVLNIGGPVRLSSEPVTVLNHPDEKRFETGDLTGKVLLLANAPHGLMNALQHSAAALVVFVEGKEHRRSRPELFESADAKWHAVPVISVQSESLAGLLKGYPDTSNWRWTTSLEGPIDRTVTLHNVAGIVPGSDPQLKRQVVMLSAHYDHIGTAETAAPFAQGSPTETDKIYNGANDDGSGTVSVIAIAAALAHSHPKRTILCMTFFGEERGLIGSEYYAAHPLFPPADTVADLNLEQVGRIDNLEDDKLVNHPLWLSLTGYGYSNLPRFVQRMAAIIGVTVYDDKQRSDQYFSESDNLSLSKLGVPSTSLSTAFDYPDYHAVGDEWQKIDYLNMARVDRAIASSALSIANSSVTPQWNAQNPATEIYRQRQQAEKRQSRRMNYGLSRNR